MQSEGSNLPLPLAPLRPPSQVFDANDQPRMDDIDRFMRNRAIPDKCRRHPDWIYG
jgi:hypothetical protein